MQDEQLILLVRVICAMSILGPLAALAVDAMLRRFTGWAIDRMLARDQAAKARSAAFHDVE